MRLVVGIFICVFQELSVCPVYSVPVNFASVNFASEKSCPLYFVDEKAVIGMY